MNAEIRFLAQQLLHAGLGPLSERDRRLIARIARRMRTAPDVNREFDQNLTFGDRLADRVAAVGGSWSFIVSFCAFLVVWAVLNGVVLIQAAFDPYPFIFLNLLLSMLAALQAPIIMMSQNRQAAKDRLAAALDYEVNVKAEAAIAELNDKVDRLTHLVSCQARAEPLEASAAHRGEDTLADPVPALDRAAAREGGAVGGGCAPPTALR